MNSVYDIADSNLILSDAKTGVNDFSMNHAFADRLDSLAKEVDGLSKCLTEKAAEIRERVDSAMQNKRQIQGVHFLTVVTNQMKKCDEARRQTEKRDYKRSEDFRTPTEWLDTSDEDEDGLETEDGKVPTKKKEQQLGEPDGHFMFSKTNENDPEAHSFMCKHCKETFRDRNDLRNHSGHHKMEFYTCLLCAKVFRSLRAFETHQKSHSIRHTCQVCHQTFALKSTLTNHLAVHSSDRHTCPHPGCKKEMKHRGNFLEHVNWSHRKTKDVPCTNCDKYFQTPSSMRAHRIHQHGYVEELVPGHPLEGKVNRPPKAANKRKPKTTYAEVQSKRYRMD